MSRVISGNIEDPEKHGFYELLYTYYSRTLLVIEYDAAPKSTLAHLHPLRRRSLIGIKPKRDKKNKPTCLHVRGS